MTHVRTPGPADGHGVAATAPSFRRLVTAAGAVLAEAGVPSAEHDARALAAHVLGVARYEPALAPEPGPAARARFAEVVERRRRREPLQHIVGSAPFRHLVLRVEPGVFVPRPETETVAQVAVDEAAAVVAARGRAVVVDLCCGAGGIAASVATEVPGTQVVAVDLEPAAVALTRTNASGADVLVLMGDATDDGLLADRAGAVDVVVSNPPYIPPDAVPTEPEVRDHDPDLALYGGGADGLLVPAGVVRTAARLLRPGGLLVMEHAEVQAHAVRSLVRATGSFTDVETRQDLTGRDRMVVARREGPDLRVLVEDSRP